MSASASTVELWTSGAKDVFGFRFRDAWRVKGWDEDQFPPTYYSEYKTAAVAVPVIPTSPQLDLFS